MRHFGPPRPSSPGRGLLVCGLLLLARWSVAAQESPTPQTETHGKYVGAQTCKACHEELYSSFERTPHWKTIEARHLPVEGRGCEACHGPGEEHVNSGGDKSKIFVFQGARASDVTTRCLMCHEYGQEHSNFQRSAHATNNVSCIDCHSPHHAKQPQFLLVDTQPALCYSCHLNVKPDFKKPFHHRVDEHFIKCSDCHNQHGGFITKQLRSTAAQDTVCLTCHTDKSGPFVYEHEPVRVEGCLACHAPHGSSNPRLLKRSQMNLLCLECHTLTVNSSAPGLPSFHNQTQKYQACTLCHTQIHGSNFNKDFFK